MVEKSRKLLSDGLWALACVLMRWSARLHPHSHMQPLYGPAKSPVEMWQSRKS